MIAAGMPEGYSSLPQPNAVAGAVLGASTWAVLALICLIELFTQAHYRSSIDPDRELSELWKDVFLFHWREASQHAILGELEWMRENARLTPGQRDGSVADLIGLVGAVDGILIGQAQSDASYFVAVCGRRMTPAQEEQVRRAFLAAYRFQYIVSGAQDTRFQEILGGMITAQHGEQIGRALQHIVADAAPIEQRKAA